MNIARPSVLAAVTISVLASIATIPASAQITINLPKIPKIKKEKPQTTTQSTQTTQTTQTSSETSTTGTKESSSETAAAKPNDCSSDAVAQVHLEDLGKTRKEAEEFTPGSRGYYVSTLSDSKNVYLEAALLPKERAKWLGHWDAEFQKCLGTALDGLAGVAKRTLPGYTGPSDYNLGSPAEKKALLSAINDLSEARVIKSGIKQANWLIEKDSYNFPTARYKHGYVLVKYPNRDHSGFCYLFWINVVQDYAGGGTYGASEGRFISRALAGCPTK